MSKLFKSNCMLWWNLFCISCFILLGNGGARKGLSLAMKGRPYFKEEAIIKTFEFYGDIIDCVDFYKQPAFDHPLLKNHTIQMRPTFIPEKSTGLPLKATAMNGSEVEYTHPWLFTKGCSEGSIPITRMSYMNGLVGNNAPASESHIHHPRYPLERGGTRLHEYAYVKFVADDDNKLLYGASAKFNVQLPSLEVWKEFSLTQIWVVSNDRTTSLEAGWMVYPKMNGDYRTRLFTFWTNNHYGTGSCYNVRCPGFVWTNRNISLDTALVPLSVYGGQQYEIQIEIFQDFKSKNWWVRVGGQLLGYWPKRIVPKLGDGAHVHAFGGEIINTRPSGHHTSTQMGSGHFAEQGYGKAAYLRNVEIMKESGSRVTYTSPQHGSMMVSNPNCYDLQLGHGMDLQFGYNFYYGGPGRSANCT